MMSQFWLITKMWPENLHFFCAIRTTILLSPGNILQFGNRLLRSFVICLLLVFPRCGSRVMTSSLIGNLVWIYRLPFVDMWMHLPMLRRLMLWMSMLHAAYLKGNLTLTAISGCNMQQFCNLMLWVLCIEIMTAWLPWTHRRRPKVWDDGPVHCRKCNRSGYTRAWLFAEYGSVASHNVSIDHVELVLSMGLLHGRCHHCERGSGWARQEPHLCRLRVLDDKLHLSYGCGINLGWRLACLPLRRGVHGLCRIRPDLHRAFTMQVVFVTSCFFFMGM